MAALSSSSSRVGRSVLVGVRGGESGGAGIWVPAVRENSTRVNVRGVKSPAMMRGAELELE